jgi:hypothetical protein
MDRDYIKVKKFLDFMRQRRVLFWKALANLFAGLLNFSKGNMPRYRRFFSPFLLHRLVQVRRAIEEVAHHFVVYHSDAEP